MKNNKKIIYSIIIIISIIVIGAGLYYVIANNEEKRENKLIEEKISSEIDYLEDKIVNLFNKMNQIEYENYKISTEKIEGNTSSSEDDTSSNSNGSSSSESSGQGNNTNSESQDTNNQSSGNQSSGQQENGQNSQTQQSAEEKENNQKYTLQAEGVLTQEINIDWDSIKIEVENIYTSIPTITLDLYQINIPQEDILNFNKQLDNLTLAIKDESKEKALTELVNIYDYIAKFTKQSTTDEMKIIGIDTKQNVLKAYSKLDSNDWTSISQDVQTAIDSFSRLLTDIKINDEKQYKSNKIYVMLNELKNSTEKQDTKLFLIKYEKLVEELNQL